jgi:hypothetical protein
MEYLGIGKTLQRVQDRSKTDFWGEEGRRMMKRKEKTKKEWEMRKEDEWKRERRKEEEKGEGKREERIRKEKK